MEVKTNIYTKRSAHTLLDFISENFTSYKQGDLNYDSTIKLIEESSCKGKYYSFLDKLKDSDTRIKDLYDGFELTNACQKWLLKWGVKK